MITHGFAIYSPDTRAFTVGEMPDRLIVLLEPDDVNVYEGFEQRGFNSYDEAVAFLLEQGCEEGEINERELLVTALYKLAKHVPEW